jgi:hypothetical protein
MKNIKYISIISLSLVLSSCSDIKGEQNFPKSDEVKRQERGGKLGDEGGIKLNLFGGNNEDSSLGVNSFLWRAALDAVAKMPIQSTDAVGGTIITDWYFMENNPNMRYRINILVLDSKLHANAVRANIFRQRKNGSEWIDEPQSDADNRELEDIILTKARDLRVQKIK